MSNAVRKLKIGFQMSQEEFASKKADEQKRITDLIENKTGGFDLRVHIIDPQTGELLAYQPYRRTVSAEGTFYYRRDASGIERKYTESGVLVDGYAGTPTPVVVVPEPDKKAEEVDSRINSLSKELDKLVQDQAQFQKAILELLAEKDKKAPSEKSEKKEK